MMVLLNLEKEKRKDQLVQDLLHLQVQKDLVLWILKAIIQAFFQVLVKDIIKEKLMQK